MLVFDIETDGLLDELTHVKCLNVLDTSTGAEERYTDFEFYEDAESGLPTGVRTKRTGTMAEGLTRLSNADIIAGQNIIGFDLPAIKKVYPKWTYSGGVYDTLVMSRVMYTNLDEQDRQAIGAGRLSRHFEEKRLVGSHSLEAWGLRLGGELKDDFKPHHYGAWTWNEYPFSVECDDYCMQDVRTNAHQLSHFLAKEWSEQCFDLEHHVAAILHRQERYGWFFDVQRAEDLTSILMQRKIELQEQCATVFQPWYVRGESKTPKAGRPELKGPYCKDAPYTKVKRVEFNPASRDHIADRLMTIYGWSPTEFTSGGKPKVDETILGTLPYPEAKLLSEFFTVDKRLGQIAEGKQAWLKQVRADQRIHGRVNTNGAVTGRMTHSNPNVAQVPANHAPYGKECRACWRVPKGKKLVGCDADGLELRMLAHYMAKFDGGAYVITVTKGTKEEGTDVHTLNMKALTLNSRDSAKTWIYAFLYGAGNFKLGTVVYDDFTDEKKAKFDAAYGTAGRRRQRALTALGKKSRDKIAAGFPALAKLVEGVKAAAKARGFLKGLDGRKLHVRSEHAALNTLLQSAGAVVMKQALVLLDADLQGDYTPGEHYEFVGNIHDEFQMEVDEEIADEIKRRASESIVRAGEVLGLRCPLAGGADVGDSWAETH